jgi:hypothetical protein
MRSALPAPLIAKPGAVRSNSHAPCSSFFKFGRYGSAEIKKCFKDLHEGLSLSSRRSLRLSRENIENMKLLHLFILRDLTIKVFLESALSNTGSVLIAVGEA